MRRVRRYDDAARVEMVPLIDVIFLLLTFFIYSLLVMSPVEVLPVQLLGLSSGESPEASQVQAITIDRSGQLFLNRKAISETELRTHLEELAEQDGPKNVYLAMERTDGDTGETAPAPAPTVDRGPLLVRLIELVRAAGIESFNIVGPKAE